MPKDVKFGLILVVGVALVCGVKRISLQSHNSAASSTPVAANAPAIKESAPPALTLPDAPKAAPKEVAAVVKQADAAKETAKKDVTKQADAVKTKSDDAVTNVFPKDLRDKVKKSGDEADKKLEDLELPGDLTLPPATKSAPAPADTKSKAPLGKTKSSLPPVKSKDAVKPAAKESAADGLTLPGDDFLKNSGSEEPAAPQKKSSSDGDFPKPLPEASNASVGSGKGPAHPYFLRFVKEGSYFVRDGDTLRSIAYNLYQDESKAGEILELNQAELKSPSDLRAGMRIRLPK